VFVLLGRIFTTTSSGAVTSSGGGGGVPGTRTPSPFLKNYMNTTQSVAASNFSFSKKSEMNDPQQRFAQLHPPQHQPPPSKKPEDIWVTVMDPKTQRKYWYNR
jgi:hypothetical protein